MKTRSAAVVNLRFAPLAHRYCSSYGEHLIENRYLWAM